ncbi:MAG: DsbA family oxidoreductase [Acidimicrobiales bacterium]
MGLDRSTLLRELGLTVVSLPLEIHPEIPVGGITLEERWRGRYGEAVAMYERIEAQLDEVGMPFNRPARVPNTRRALQTAEWVRANAPESFEAVERSMYEAHFVDNRPLDDPDVVDALVASSGADAAEARRAVEAGELHNALEAAASLAFSVGVSGTPAWLIARRAFIPGAVGRDVFRSVVSRLTSPGPA